MTQALYRKWRSRTFSDLVGQPHVVRTLENALKADRVAHAYLFNGPRGTGKTSTARLLAKALNCTREDGRVPCGACPACLAIEENRYLDLIEIDAASNNGVDDIRELRNGVSFSATEGNSKVYIVDEVHMLSPSAFNALLKTLEEPPPHVFFILATTEIHRIPATVISRCQRFDFRRIATQDVQAHLAMIAAAEGCAAEPAALAVIASSAQGCMRDAISLLDQVVGFGHGQVTLQQVQSILGLTDMQAVNAFVDSLARQDKGQGLTVLQDVLTQGGSLAEFLQQVILQLRFAFRLQLTGDETVIPDVSPDQKEVLRGWIKDWAEERLLHALSTMMETAAQLGQAVHPHILVELALVNAIDGPPPARPVAAATDAVARPAPAARARPSPQERSPSPVSAQPKRAPRSEAAMSQADQAKVAILRPHWRELGREVKKRFGSQAFKALTVEGFSRIHIQGASVSLIFKEKRFKDALLPGPSQKYITQMLEDWLGEKVQLHLQVESGPGAKNGARAARPAPANADPMKELDELIMSQLHAQRLDMQQESALLRALEQAKKQE